MSKARHRARKGCCNHVGELATAQGDIRLMSELIERITEQRDSLERQVRALRMELTGERPTEVLSKAQIRAQMRRTAPDAVPVVTVEGSTMLLPVGKIRARRARPSWAVQ